MVLFYLNFPCLKRGVADEDRLVSAVEQLAGVSI